MRKILDSPPHVQFSTFSIEAAAKWRHNGWTIPACEHLHWTLADGLPREQVARIRAFIESIRNLHGPSGHCFSKFGSICHVPPPQMKMIASTICEITGARP